MLSRAQEARVREILGSHALGTRPAYCLEYLAATAQIPSVHLADLAARQGAALFHECHASTLTGGLLTAPPAAEEQQAARAPRIGFLWGGTPPPSLLRQFDPAVAPAASGPGDRVTDRTRGCSH